jgi:hypothetical protein
MRNAILVEGIEVVAVNEYVVSNLVAEVKLIFVIAARLSTLTTWFVLMGNLSEICPSLIC